MDKRNLAAKYRPRKLEDMVGADSAVEVLRPIFKRKHPPTVLLFTGPSGTGKTTLSRMVARYLNCKTGDACGKCHNCKTLDDSEEHPDLLEINAAEQRKIDDMRELVSGIRFHAQMGKIRIVYLDEVHQLTKESFQLLLKHLEEPPDHTIFILATTNPEKLPDAVMTRSSIKISLRHIEPEVMIPHLHNVARKEGFNFLKMGKGDKDEQRKKGKKLLRTVAELSNGSMREGLNVLETLILTAEDNRHKTLEQLAVAFQKRLDFSADQVAVKVLFNVYRGSTRRAVRALYDQEELVRQVMHKMRWTNDRLIRLTLEVKVGWFDIAFKDLLGLLKEQKMKVPLETLLEVQKQLNIAEARMNSLNIGELILMSDAVYDMCRVSANNSKSEE